jgi:hypothetical protein
MCAVQDGSLDGHAVDGSLDDGVLFRMDAATELMALT